MPDVLLPRPGTDLNAWAVVACDQFTSQPEYWQQAAGLVGDKPSTLNLILPGYTSTRRAPTTGVRSINDTMRRYLADGLLNTHPATMVLVRRETAHGAVRSGGA